MKILVSHVNVHQRVTSAEEDFNNPVDTSQVISPAFPMNAQWALEQSSYGGRGRGHAWAELA